MYDLSKMGGVKFEMSFLNLHSTQGAKVKSRSMQKKVPSLRDINNWCYFRMLFE